MTEHKWAPTQDDNQERFPSSVAICNPPPEKTTRKLTQIEGAHDVSRVIPEFLLVHLLLSLSLTFPTSGKKEAVMKDRSE